MATYQELLDAIARVGAATGDGRAWMAGLSGADLAVVTSPASVVAANAVDDVLTKIHAQHRQIFDPPTQAAPAGPDLTPGEGTAAEAIWTAETSLAHQTSASAQLDLQVVAAVLNAHAGHAAGRAALDGLQHDIESAVATRTDLDTPAGARAFQRYLIGKLRDIRTVVETAGLDATSKAALAAALASLYAAAAPESGDQPRPTPAPADGAGEQRPREDVPPADPMADPLLDSLFPEDLADPAAAAPAAAAPASAPLVPPMAAMPALGGAGIPGGGVPAAFPPLSPPSLGDSAPLRVPAVDDGALFDDPPVDEPADEPDAVTEDTTDTDEETPEPSPSETVVHLPNGESVTASSPQLAAAITAAVAGTPIPEAFRQQGITIPPPGSAVPHPVEPARLMAGDIGVLTDRHALALGNGKAVFNNQIQPIASVTGPSFLGWEHPPQPGARAESGSSNQPTPTRPAVTAGPPAIGE